MFDASGNSLSEVNCVSLMLQVLVCRRSTVCLMLQVSLSEVNFVCLMLQVIVCQRSTVCV